MLIFYFKARPKTNSLGISTRGRLNSAIPTPGDQYKKDRELMKKGI